MLAALTSLALSSCSGAESPAPADPTASAVSAESSSSGGDASPSASPTQKPYLPVPEGVSLTPQGSLLGVGDTATVAYRPRQGKVGVLDLRVTSLVRTTFEESFQNWKLDDKTMQQTPYFVEVKVKNRGNSDLGGRPVPLYLLDGADTLVESSTFDGDFTPCPSTPLPKKFAKGATDKVCLVFLAPRGEKLAGVSFRPDQAFTAITWNGKVEAIGGAGRSGKKPDAAKSGGKNSN